MDNKVISATASVLKFEDPTLEFELVGDRIVFGDRNIRWNGEQYQLFLDEELVMEAPFVERLVAEIKGDNDVLEWMDHHAEFLVEASLNV